MLRAVALHGFRGGRSSRELDVQRNVSDAKRAWSPRHWFWSAGAATSLRCAGVARRVGAAGIQSWSVRFCVCSASRWPARRPARCCAALPFLRPADVAPTLVLVLASGVGALIAAWSPCCRPIRSPAYASNSGSGSGRARCSVRAAVRSVRTIPRIDAKATLEGNPHRFRRTRARGHRQRGRRDRDHRLSTARSCRSIAPLTGCSATTSTK